MNLGATTAGASMSVLFLLLCVVGITFSFWMAWKRWQAKQDLPYIPQDEKRCATSVMRCGVSYDLPRLGRYTYPYAKLWIGPNSIVVSCKGQPDIGMNRKTTRVERHRSLPILRAYRLANDGVVITVFVRDDRELLAALPPTMG